MLFFNIYILPNNIKIISLITWLSFLENEAKLQIEPPVKRSVSTSHMPIDLNSELKSRLKKSTHASVSNLKKSSTNIGLSGCTKYDNDTNQTVSLVRLRASPDSSSSSDFDGKDLGKLLRSVSKENVLTNISSVAAPEVQNMSLALENISKRLNTVATEDSYKNASTSEGESSGGREINTIIKNNAVARRKKFNDG